MGARTSQPAKPDGPHHVGAPWSAVESVRQNLQNAAKELASEYLAAPPPHGTALMLACMRPAEEPDDASSADSADEALDTRAPPQARGAGKISRARTACVWTAFAYALSHHIDSGASEPADALSPCWLHTARALWRAAGVRGVLGIPLLRPAVIMARTPGCAALLAWLVAAAAVCPQPDCVPALLTATHVFDTQTPAVAACYACALDAARVTPHVSVFRLLQRQLECNCAAVRVCVHAAIQWCARQRDIEAASVDTDELKVTALRLVVCSNRQSAAARDTEPLLAHWLKGCAAVVRALTGSPRLPSTLSDAHSVLLRVILDGCALCSPPRDTTAALAAVAYVPNDVLLALGPRVADAVRGLYDTVPHAAPAIPPLAAPPQRRNTYRRRRLGADHATPWWDHVGFAPPASAAVSTEATLARPLPPPDVGATPWWKHVGFAPPASAAVSTEATLARPLPPPDVGADPPPDVGATPWWKHVGFAPPASAAVSTEGAAGSNPPVNYDGDVESDDGLLDDDALVHAAVNPASPAQEAQDAVVPAPEAAASREPSAPLSTDDTSQQPSVQVAGGGSLPPQPQADTIATRTRARSKKHTNVSTGTGATSVAKASNAFRALKPALRTADTTTSGGTDEAAATGDTTVAAAASASADAAVPALPPTAKRKSVHWPSAPKLEATRYFNTCDT